MTNAVKYRGAAVRSTAQQDSQRRRQTQRCQRRRGDAGRTGRVGGQGNVRVAEEAPSEGARAGLDVGSRARHCGRVAVDRVVGLGERAGLVGRGRRWRWEVGGRLRRRPPVRHAARQPLRIGGRQHRGDVKFHPAAAVSGGESRLPSNHPHLAAQRAQIPAMFPALFVERPT
jgi:hypothetical protein